MDDPYIVTDLNRRVIGYLWESLDRLPNAPIVSYRIARPMQPDVDIDLIWETRNPSDPDLSYLMTSSPQQHLMLIMGYRPASGGD